MQEIHDLASLFTRGLPMLDVRAPVEFHAGAIPGAVNRPLLDDGQRQRVGLCYRQHGQDAAIALGERLVSGALREERIAAWLEFARAHPEGVLYCFRGGLRSRITQQWLAQAGVSVPRVAGGYKAMRQFLIAALDSVAAECRFTILGGLTGCGKTEVLASLHSGQAVDLERHAHHRGSSFGARLQAQPGQVDFEHTLAVDFLRRRAAGMQHFLLEDESRFIGSRNLPAHLYAQMQAAPLVWLEAPFEERIERIRADYVTSLLDELRPQEGEDSAWLAFGERLQAGLARIARRLGDQNFRRAGALMQAALERHRTHGDARGHDAWIALLLTHYYDPMYASQRDTLDRRIAFRGDRSAVCAWLSAGHHEAGNAVA